jgi:predicted nucleic acid-binding protein
MNVVDSSAWLAYFANEGNAEFFAAAVEDTGLLIVPIVCLYEVFKVILRERGEDDALQAVSVMQQGMIVDMDSDLALEAAVIGHEEKLAFADSVIYAVAKRHQATVWTQDEHFAGRENVQYKPKAKSTVVQSVLDPVDEETVFTNEEFVGLHRKLANVGFLKKSAVTKDADWVFNFAKGRDQTLLGVKNFFEHAGTDFTRRELLLLHFMLAHTNEKGECSGAGE